MSSRDPADRALIARIGGLESWARTPDRAARTAPARRAWNAKFEQEVDPDGVLPDAERARRADAARRAHFLRMARKSADKRRKPRPGDPGERAAQARAERDARRDAS